jgi:hypothetical protein
MRRVKAIWQTVLAAMWRTRLPLTLLIGVVTLGTFIFWVTGAQANWLKALFYTLNLITLQASPSDAPDDLGLQVASLAVLIGGVSAIAGGAANVVDYIRDPQERQLALAHTYKNHVVVCGVGRVGYRVINELLAAHVAVVAVNRTPDEEWLPHLQRNNIPVIIGDARRTQTLVDAGVPYAKSIVACTSDDLTNLDIALDARELNKNIRVVLRMFDEKLGANVKKNFNFDEVISVSAIAAPIISKAAQ